MCGWIEILLQRRLLTMLSNSDVFPLTDYFTYMAPLDAGQPFWNTHHVLRGSLRAGGMTGSHSQDFQELTVKRPPLQTLTGHPVPCG